MELTTERLTLRPFTQGDAPAIVEWESDPDVITFLTFDQDRTDESAREHVCRSREQARQEPRREYTFAIAPRDGGRAVGEVRLRLPVPGGTGDHAVPFTGPFSCRAQRDVAPMLLLIRRLVVRCL